MFWQTLTTSDILRWVAIFLGVGLATWAGIGMLRRWMLSRQMVVVPNARSSHAVPTPQGAGAIMVAMVFFAWIILFVHHHDLVTMRDYAVLAAAACVALISWLDDRAHISFKWRLLVHAIAAAAAVFALPDGAAIFPDWLPLWLERTLMAVGLVWFMNLFNFMDGIDGMLGSLTATIALGISAVTPAWLDWQLSLVLVPIAIGFLIWNWQPAKIFMGDVGSVTLGYLIGWLLLRLALSGNYMPAIILAAYPVADTTFTLVRRVAQGEKFWEPHRRHFFQKAVRSGMQHAVVVRAVWVLQIFLIIMALWATYRRISPAVLTILAVTGWLSYCQWRFKYFDGKNSA
jgi:UDP-N-acetylmuramyl pentapeptide phosphotransferase/UDP-N-acetylglucosamine-1-phosphate transferase